MSKIQTSIVGALLATSGASAQTEFTPTQAPARRLGSHQMPQMSAANEGRQLLQTVNTRPDPGPNRSWEDYQWNMGSLSEGGANGFESHSLATGKGVTIAVESKGHAVVTEEFTPPLDIASSYADAESAYKPETFNSDGLSGFGLTGIVAAKANGVGTTGQAPDAQTVLLQSSSDASLEEVLAWAGGIKSDNAAAVARSKPADVILLTSNFVGQPNATACPEPIQKLINQIAQAGSIIIAALDSVTTTEVSGMNPSLCDNVIGVAGADRDGVFVEFNTNGTSRADIGAPVGYKPDPSENKNDFDYAVLTQGSKRADSDEVGYSSYSRTNSESAAQLTGIAGQAKELKCDLTVQQFRQVIQETAVDYQTPCFESQCGAGRVDAYAVLTKIKSMDAGQCEEVVAPMTAPEAQPPGSVANETDTSTNNGLTPVTQNPALENESPTNTAPKNSNFALALAVAALGYLAA